MEFGKAVVKDHLEALDEKLMLNRDTKKYRHKGRRKTAVKTKLGTIEYSRRIYFDTNETKHVFLLDEAMEPQNIGLFDETICKQIEEMICNQSFLGTASSIKAAYASFEPARDFRKHMENVTASVYNTDEIELCVKNGDGAQWIQKDDSCDCICVLDKFHRNKKITECVSNKKIAENLRELLLQNRFDELLLSSSSRRTGGRSLLSVFAEAVIPLYFLPNSVEKSATMHKSPACLFVSKIRSMKLNTEFDTIQR